jgi:hypothetical protein
MTRTFFVPAILVVPLATALVTVQTSRAEPAVDECKTKPDSSAPVGSHWYYRVNRADQRHCWYLGPEGAKVRSQAREGASRVSRPTGTAPAREDSPETTQAMPPPMEPAQRTTAESASVAVAKDLAASSSDVPKTPDLVVQEPATLSNRDTEDHQATEAHEEMPLIWPVLAEADRAGLADSAGEFAPWPAVLVGALALLLAGAIFKLARRHAQSSRRDQRQVGLRTKQKRRAYSEHVNAGPNQVARRSAVRMQRDNPVLQRPTSIDPVEATTLRELMRDLRRAAA